MPKYATEPSLEQSSTFVERKRLRRVRMIVELTLNLISTDRDVSHREARCLVDCARKAILDIHPAFSDGYEKAVAPQFERALRHRWPAEELLYGDSDIVN